MTPRHLLGFSAIAMTLTAYLALCASSAYAQDAYTTGGARLPARAGSFSLKIEPGLAFPLTTPQSRLFDVGGGQSVKAFWALTPFLDIGPSATFIGLPAAEEDSDPGTAWALGASVQLKRPHHAGSNMFSAISPWADLDLLFVQTDGLSRPGLAVGAGLAVPIGKARAFWVGPFVRFFQIMSGERSGFNDDDARILSLGVSLEVSSGVERERLAPISSGSEPITVIKQVVSCPDRDADGLPDSVDRCPDVPGPTDNWGCRQFQKIVVKPDKLELKEKLYFAWDQATLQEVSYPVLDEVVQALNDNKSFRVQVEGHSSSDGPNDHNQSLSEQRAQAVLDYLVAHGIAKERLGSKGFSSSVPMATNATAEGRESNRRVEFVVTFNILDAESN